MKIQISTPLWVIIVFILAVLILALPRQAHDWRVTSDNVTIVTGDYNRIGGDSPSPPPPQGDDGWLLGFLQAFVGIFVPVAILAGVVVAAMGGRR